MKIHEGGASKRRPGDLGPGIDVSAAVSLGAGAPRPTVLRAVDQVDVGTLREGVTRFFLAEGGGAGAGKAWTTLSHDFDVLGATVLAAGDPEQRTWVPLVGARVVLRLRTEGEGFAAFDLCTKGDGATVALPARVVVGADGRSVSTPLGSLLHCPIVKGAAWRLEVEAPGFEGAVARVVLHGVEAQEAT